MTAPGPASFAGRRDGRRRRADGRGRPYPVFGEDADLRDLALAATRALVHAHDADEVHDVLCTVVHDLGGTIVAARFEPADALPVDLALGAGDPLLVVVDPLSPAAMRLEQLLPALVDDARAVVARLSEPVPRALGRDRAPDDALPRYLALLERADRLGAQRLVQRELRAGVAPAALVQQVLAPAQREVGERWYRGEWSVADEHAATAVTDAVSALLPVEQAGPHVVLVAPSGEWHTLPARLAAAQSEGVRTTVLGPGLPPDHLFRYLDAVAPDLLGVSCTLGTSLIAAAETVQAAHDAGIPVVAGGRAFGSSPRRALALGADAWAASPADLSRLATTLLPREDVVQLPAEALLADAVPTELLVLALERQAAAAPWVGAMSERQRGSSLDDLRWITRHAAAALACDDVTVLDDLLQWLDRLLLARGVPPHVLPDGVRYLADVLESDTPTVAALVVDAVGRLPREP